MGEKRRERGRMRGRCLGPASQAATSQADMEYGIQNERTVKSPQAKYR